MRRRDTEKKEGKERRIRRMRKEEREERERGRREGGGGKGERGRKRCLLTCLLQEDASYPHKQCCGVSCYHGNSAYETKQ